MPLRPAFINTAYLRTYDQLPPHSQHLKSKQTWLKYTLTSRQTARLSVHEVGLYLLLTLAKPAYADCLSQAFSRTTVPTMLAVASLHQSSYSGHFLLSSAQSFLANCQRKKSSSRIPSKMPAPPHIAGLPQLVVLLHVASQAQASTVKSRTRIVHDSSGTRQTSTLQSNNETAP